MKTICNPLIGLTLTLAILVGCTSDSVMQPEPCMEVLTYEAGVDQLIQNNCNLSGCHDGSGGVGNYNSYQGIQRSLENGQFKQLVLIERSMPKGQSLSEAEYEIFRCWAENNFPQN
ncbi:MAG: hypothetical protein HKN87_11405 [Saprospiraceae bacterium]|nr:hypothetical protein [Saprospiraceae bacterium]